MAADVLVCPAASRAMAVSVCEPAPEAAASHDAEYGALVSSAPTLTPSTRNCTPTTPTASLALAVTVTVPLTDAPEAGEVIDTVGAVVSTLFTVTLRLADVVVLPAASRATAVITCAPLLAVSVSQLREYETVVSSVPTLTPSTRNCPPATPTLSLDVAASVTVPLTAAPSAGDVSDTTGGTVSTLSTVTVRLTDVVVLPAASRATAVTVCGPSDTVALLHEIEYGDVASSDPTLAPSTWN